MKNNILPTTNAVRRESILALCFFVGMLNFALNTDYAHAQETPPPITVQIHFVNVDLEHPTATLGPNSCSATAPATCVNNSEVSLTSTVSFTKPSTADVKLALDGKGNYTITQTVTTPARVDDCVTPINCGGIAVVDVGWSLPVQETNATATLSATGLGLGGNANFLWSAGNVGPFCLFVEFSMVFGPQCQGFPSNNYQTGATFTEPVAAPGIKPPPSLKDVFGRSFVACGPDAGACTAKVVTTITPGDVIILSNTSPGERGVLVNGLLNGEAPPDGQWNHQTFTSSMDTIQLGANLTQSSETNGNEIVAFTNDRPVTLMQNVDWTPDSDNIQMPFFSNGPLIIPMRIWIVQGNYKVRQLQASKQVLVANSVWKNERMGMHVELDEIADKTANASAPKFYNIDLDLKEECVDSQLADLKNSIGFASGKVNVYYIMTVDMDKTIRGVTCTKAQAGGEKIIAIANGLLADVLVHELGHAMGLGHVNAVSDFNADNVMWQGGISRIFLTEGQTFQANLASYSEVNLLNLRGTAPTRNCPLTIDLSLASNYTLVTNQMLDCPGIDKRIWADGSLTPN